MTPKSLSKLYRKLNWSKSPNCRHNFAKRAEETHKLFEPMQREYLKRLHDWDYDGPCLVGRPDSLKSMQDQFSWGGKEKGKQAAAGGDSDSDYGEQRRVDKDGNSRARKDAQYAFGVKNTKRSAAEGGGRREKMPSASTFRPPTSKKSGPSTESSSSSSSASSSSSSSSASASSSSNAKPGGMKIRGRKIIGSSSVVGMKGKYILFRHVDPQWQKKCKFPVLIGQVLSENSDPTNPSGWKGRPDGSTDPLTGEPYREKWTLAVKRFALTLTVGKTRTDVPTIRFARYSHPKVILDHEKATNHSTWFMDEEFCERLVKKSTKKGTTWGQGVTYLDFDNPSHGFKLLDADPVFTNNNLLSKFTLKNIYTNDLAARHGLDRYIQEVFDEKKPKVGKKQAETGRVPKVDASQGGQECTQEDPGTISPFLALLNSVPENDDDDDTGGIMSDEEDDGDSSEQKIATIPHSAEVDDLLRNGLEQAMREQDSTALVAVPTSSSSTSAASIPRPACHPSSSSTGRAGRQEPKPKEKKDAKSTKSVIPEK